MDEYDGRQFVGIDLHRRRSVIVRHRSYRHNPHFPRKHHARILLQATLLALERRSCHVFADYCQLVLDRTPTVGRSLRSSALRC